MTTAPGTLAARFRDMTDARAAIEALENQGVDGSDIVLAGRVAHEASTPGDEEPTDERIIRHVGSRVVAGAAIGAAVGAVLGVLVTVASSVDSSVVFGSVLAGLLIGGIAGTFVSFERGVGHSESWELTFHDPASGAVWVTIATDEPETIGTATEVLHSLHPMEVRRR
jgi:hypothetical protein